MNAVNKGLALALCMLVKLQAEGAPMNYWVLADLAQIRKEPLAKASVLGSLAAGTSLRAKQSRGDWVYLDSLDGVSIGGWIHKSLVSEVLVDEKFFLKRIAESPDSKDSLKWFERLVALMPRKTEYAEALQSGYLAHGEADKARSLGRRSRGTEETYLARFEGEELLVIGTLDSNGEFQNLLWDETETETDAGKIKERSQSGALIRKKALEKMISLASRDWYAMGETESSGWRFHTAAISKGVDFDVENTGTFGVSLGRAVDVFKRTYGRSFFATQPFYDVPSTGIRRKAEWDSLDWFKKKLVGEAFDSTGAYAVEFRNLEEYGFVDITMKGGATPPWHYPGMWSQRGIFDRARKQVWPPEFEGGNQGFFKPEDELIPQAPSRWFRFGGSPASPAFIILPFSTDPPANFRKDVEDGSRVGPYGFRLLRVKKDEVKIFHIRSSNAGC